MKKKISESDIEYVVGTIFKNGEYAVESPRGDKVYQIHTGNSTFYTDEMGVEQIKEAVKIKIDGKSTE